MGENSVGALPVHLRKETAYQKRLSCARELFVSYANRLRDRRTPVLAVLGLYLILSNLPLLLSAGTLDGLPHGYINVECLLIGALGIYLPRGVVFAALLLESTLDLAYSICYTYRFSLGELLTSFRYLTSMPAVRLMQGSLILGLSVVACAVLALARPRRQTRMFTTAALLACIAVPTVIDMINGQNFLWRKDATLSSYRLVRSPALVLVLWEISSIRIGLHSHSTNDSPMNSASAAMMGYFDGRASGAESPNVVLIMVESWGLPLDSRLAHGLIASYDDPRIASRYKISLGTAPFTGLTVPGEARELCHSTIGFGILYAAPELRERCLPAFFHEHGYQNIAIHGFVGPMFYRNIWYPALGFDRSWFRSDLRKIGMPDCPGAFPGICDRSIAGWIGGSLLSEQKEKPQFIYWVTLNSHLPEPAHPDLPDDGVCATQPTLRNSAALCSWFRLVRAVHESMEQTALIRTARPTVFILVGDHAPPFSDPELRAKFSNTEVPYEMLMPLPPSDPQ
jgi:hypothetical protein